MYQVEQVLVPVDFSTSSRAALAFARAIGKNSPRIHLAHALGEWRPYVRRVLFPYAALGEDDVEFEHELIEEARAHMLAHLEVNPDKDKSIADLTMQIGPVKETLSERVRSVGPDMVVMGAFGEGGVQPNVLGSTAEKLLRAVTRPVVLVRDYDPKPSIDHIVVAVDLTSRSTDVVAKALGFALQVGATIELVYVLPDPLTQDTNKILARTLDFNATKILERSRSKIEALFDRMVDHVEVAYPEQDSARELLQQRKVMVGDPPRVIVDHADKVDADMVVVGGHNTQSASHRQLGRIAWTIARTAPTHVMVVPPEKEVSLLGNDES
ncbi:universal stress protein [Persicimonas caeni]|jgi:nucleotide-binding universal stress UspA family protein|uniref:Universal stress protein n=1 Tax=Persicimonas caeni TaxID=2292766 RepID=A0A4Y6PVL0_PERCE|nr:universal stress protein [Persicimonas caeni]QDG51775.1 universal stress protein [Persicimonas caeni]QED32996.1 universal stress protein [Persicimonas caeni]